MITQPTAQPTAQSIALTYVEAQLVARQEAIVEYQATFAQDPLYGMLWKGEALQTEKEVCRRLTHLQKALSKDGPDVRAILAERMEQVCEDIQDWEPTRSTSAIANVLDIAINRGRQTFRKLLLAIEKEIANF